MNQPTYLCKRWKSRTLPRVSDPWKKTRNTECHVCMYAAKERGRQAQCSEVELSLVVVPCTVVGCSIFDYSALPHIALFWVTLHCLKLQCIAFDWIAKCIKLHCIEVRFVWQLTLVSHLNKIALNMNDTKLLWVKLHCDAVRIFWRLTLVSVVQVVGHPHCSSFIRMKSLHLIALHLN